MRVRDKVEFLQRLAADPSRSAEERDVLVEAAHLLLEHAPAVHAPEDPTIPPREAPVERALMWTDGAARGNPGPAGAGVVLRTVGGEDLARISRYLGETTNNVAEYQALLSGLREALRRGVRALEVFADSELLIKQMSGVYRVKSENIKPLFEQAKALVSKFDEVKFVHIRREHNTQADALANEGIDVQRTSPPELA